MDLYYSPLTSDCRSILMIGKALNIQFNKTVLNVAEQEHQKPEFAKINPQRAIPTIVDNGLTLCESRAILIYLVEKYAKDDALYPKDPKGRAVVNQRLFFDVGTLYKSFADYFYPQFTKKQPADPELLKKLQEAVGFLNAFLEGQQYVAGDRLTIADISILATVSTIAMANFDLGKYPNVTRWYENAKKVTPGWDENEKGLIEGRALLEKLKQ
ncbi:glutathione S-transferase D1 [Drosophila grimshawi]|uniref:GH18970 n=1 Tax=Drosophila grimshawi TaxID=7222 RepID=B4JS31_DROGR|nr:glutathione S-transferase D1 [Drosophila grimshawi]EDV94571.1 GH18970 [Drosophila grimshawi]